MQLHTLPPNTQRCFHDSVQYQLCFEATVFGGILKGKAVCFEQYQRIILHAIYCPLFELRARVAKLVVFVCYDKADTTRKSCFGSLFDAGVISILTMPNAEVKLNTRKIDWTRLKLKKMLLRTPKQQQIQREGTA